MYKNEWKDMRSIFVRFRMVLDWLKTDKDKTNYQDSLFIYPPVYV